jgi:hypothetical protein
MRRRPIRGMQTTPIPGYPLPTDKLTDYNTALGDELALPDDLTETFTNVVAQIFPLAADMSVLQQFLDGYLNFPSDGENPPVYFKPAAPFVMLEVLNYGSVASNTENVGWFSEHEVAFGIPLEWYARDPRGNLTFLTYALIYPYIFVDNSVALSGGREIYGWSKAPIVVNAIASAFQPGNNQTLLSADLIDPDGSGSDSHAHLLRIQETQLLQPSVSNLGGIMTAVPLAIAASVNAAIDLLQLGGSGSKGSAGHIGMLRKILPRLYGDLNRFLPAALQTSSAGTGDSCESSPPVSIITLKQVREIEDPAEVYQGLACYQGIIESEMSIVKLIDAGSFIDPSNPDPSGGIYIDLAATMPEVSKLGIPAAPVTTADWGVVQRLTPVLPFWVKMDLTYGLAGYQTWRTSQTYWTENNCPRVRPTTQKISYIELGSGAVEEIPTPVTFPQVTMRFMPLAADGDILSDLIEQYLGNQYFDFTLDAPASGPAFVHLILSNFSQMQTSEYGDPDLPTADQEMTFAVPVIWTNKRTGNSGPGLVPLYTFAGTYWNTITTFEVYGRLTLKSDFISPPFNNFFPPPIQLGGNLNVTIATELFPNTTSGQKLQELPLVQCYTIYNESSTSSPNPVSVTDTFLKGIGLGQFGSTPIDFFTLGLKQIRDANNPAKADYQAAVFLGRRFTQTLPNFFSTGVGIHLFYYPNAALVETLGLVVAGQYSVGQQVVQVVNAVNPFFMQGFMQSISADIGWWQIGENLIAPEPTFNP